jgi:hypothetical protein
MVFMEIIKETTIWNCGHAVPNHTYLLNNKGKVIAYVKESDNSIIQLKSGFILKKSYRKFIKVNNPALSKIAESYKEVNVIKPNVRVFNVKSKNRDYHVEYDNGMITCGCIGFGYRGKCKHAEAVSKQMGL